MSDGQGTTWEAVARLREAGRLPEAARRLDELIRGRQMSSLDRGLLVETVRVALLQHQPEAAYSAYLALKQSPGPGLWEREYLTRLQIAAGRPITELADPSLQSRSEWLSRYMERGEDAVYPVSMVDYSVKCVVEAALYTFKVACPSCHSSYEVEVYKTLMIDRRYLCPICLAQQQIGYDRIRTFLRERVSQSQRTAILRADTKLHAMLLQLNADTLHGEHFSLIPRYLSHDYIVALNELAAERLALRCGAGEQ